MSDNISRADAIEALCHDCAYYTDAQCKTDSGYWCESGAMIREDIPSAEAEWIPVSERLPRDDNDYLVVDGDGEMAVGYYRDDANAWDNDCFGWLEREDEDEHPTRLGKVVAWMPLSKSHKEKSEV